MIIREITIENIDGYRGFIPPDIAENIGRLNFRGLSVHSPLDEKVEAAMVWDWKKAEPESTEREAEIRWIGVNAEDAGQQLLIAYKERAEDEGISRTFFEFPSLQDMARDVLTDAGFRIEEGESQDITTTLGEDTADNLPDIKPCPGVMPIRALMAKEFKKRLEEIGHLARQGVQDDLLTLPMYWYDLDISSCIQSEDGLTGFFLIHVSESGKLIPELLFAKGTDNRIAILSMLRFTFSEAALKYPADTIFCLRGDFDIRGDLKRAFFPGYQGEPVIRGERFL